METQVNRGKLASFVAIAALLAACGQQEATNPVIADVPEFSAREFFETTSFSMVDSRGYAFSPDGKSILISSDKSGVFNAVTLPVSGGEFQPVTDSADNAVFAVSYFPDDGRVLYTYDSGGNELNHVAVREVDGKNRDLTPGENLKADFLGWSADGQHFYLATTERDQMNFDVYRYASDGYARELVFENPGMLLEAISGDGRWLALVQRINSADSDIYIVDLASDNPAPQLITPHEGNISHGVFTITPDSKHLVYSTDEFGEFTQAWRYEFASGATSALLVADWDVSYVLYSPSGRFLVSGVNADARTEVSIVDTQSGKPVPMPALPRGDLASVRFTSDESALALMVTADTAPPNIYYVDLAQRSANQLTEALNPAIKPEFLVTSEVVRYKSFDDLDIPAILYKPQGASANDTVPALVWVHGGPGGQSRTGYSATVQHLVNHGYAVLMANNRGSSGYGKTFYHLDDKRHGEEDLQDIVYGRRYLESLDWVDGERIGIIGGSYGGYMVAAALAFEPEAFDVGINIFGVTNWVRTLQSIPPWWEAFKVALYDEMGDPETDAERHRRISPLFHADNIVKPLLVVQGANDPRVLQAESDELVAAVRANEVPVEYVLFPDEGHGFRKRENRIVASEAYLAFLDTWLRREDGAAL